MLLFVLLFNPKRLLMCLLELSINILKDGYVSKAAIMATLSNQTNKDCFVPVVRIDYISVNARFGAFFCHTRNPLV